MSARSVRQPRPHLFTIGNRRGHEDALAPNNGRGMSLARQRHLPADVFVLAPFDGRIGVGRNTSAQWAAPLRPVMLRLVWTPVGTRSGGASSPEGCRGSHAREEEQLVHGPFSPGTLKRPFTI